MNTKFLRWLLTGVAWLPLCFLLSFAPPGDVTDIINKLIAYNTYRRQEKIYLHTDKPMYAAGEDIWFKAYLVDASYHNPDSMSGVAYVELLNEKKELLARRILAIQQAGAAGDFHLGDSLQQGKYFIRAYTNYMKNVDEDFFFVKEFQVLNPSYKATPEANGQAATKIDLQFFPEGGHLVAGAENRLAFKAINGLGKGVDVEGEIVDEENKVVAVFRSTHLGMGMCKLATFPGKKYVARLKGSSTAYALPTMLDSGFLLKVVDAEQNMRVFIYNTLKRSPESRVNRLYMVAHSRGVPCFAANADDSRAAFVTEIPKSRFPSGIAHITLFDQQGVPQCERLFFINHQQSLRFSLSSNKTSYEHREKAELEVLVKDKTGKPVAGNFSLSVYDTKVLNPNRYPLDINSYLLLTSDLKGYVEEPGYYFKDTLPDTRAKADLLMMTQGWRRFNWLEIGKDSLAALAYFPERGLVLSGLVNKSLVNKPAPNSQLTIMTKSGAFLVTQTDLQGRFYVDELYYQDSTTIVIQTNNAKGKQSDLRLKVNPFNPSPPVRFVSFPLPAVNAADFLRQNAQRNAIERAMKFEKDQIVLREVVVKANKPKEPADNRFRLYGTPDDVIKMSEVPGGYTNILSAIQGRIAGVQVMGGSPPSVQIRGSSTNPLFLLDGMQVEIEMIQSINPNDVETIEVLKNIGSTAMYGSRGSGGVIAIYTKRGGGYPSPTIGIVSLPYPGFYRAREFYSPKYPLPDSDSNTVTHPDIRTTLYWNPSIVTDANGKAQVSFFTSDVSATYSIGVEGITKDGTAGSFRGEMAVK